MVEVVEYRISLGALADPAPRVAGGLHPCAACHVTCRGMSSSHDGPEPCLSSSRRTVTATAPCTFTFHSTPLHSTSHPTPRSDPRSIVQRTDRPGHPSRTIPHLTYLNSQTPPPCRHDLHHQQQHPSRDPPRVRPPVALLPRQHGHVRPLAGGRGAQSGGAGRASGGD